MTTFVLVPGGRHGGWWFEPVAVSDVADVLAEIATGPPQGLTLEPTGPETQDLVDTARCTLAARGDRVRLIPSWRDGDELAVARGQTPIGQYGRVLQTGAYAVAAPHGAPNGCSLWPIRVQHTNYV
jgi:uncharacterized protein YbjT (DUF2867 family)